MPRRPGDSKIRAAAGDGNIFTQAPVLRAVGGGQALHDQGVPRVSPARGGWGDVAGACRGPLQGVRVGGHKLKCGFIE